MCPETQTHVPSVTTILSKTADKTALLLWEEAIGKKRADRVRDEATALGSLMHTHVENYIAGIDRPKGNHLLRLQAARMADQIIEKGLPNVDEVWGIETSQYVPSLFAGTCDLIGIHGGEPAVMDHKSAKAIKTEDMIQDYFAQLGAYSLASDTVWGTKIKKGVIFMVSRDLKYKEFVLNYDDLRRHQDNFLDRVDQYLQMA